MRVMKGKSSRFLVGAEGFLAPSRSSQPALPVLDAPSECTSGLETAKVCVLSHARGPELVKLGLSEVSGSLSFLFCSKTHKEGEA